VEVPVREVGGARHETLLHLVKAYNQIIDAHESDPGLHIEHNG